MATAMAAPATMPCTIHDLVEEHEDSDDEQIDIGLRFSPHTLFGPLSLRIVFVFTFSCYLSFYFLPGSSSCNAEKDGSFSGPPGPTGTSRKKKVKESGEMERYEESGSRKEEFKELFDTSLIIVLCIVSLYECQTSPEHNLGVLLVHLFDIYGRKLNTTDVGVSCKGKGTFFKKSSKGRQRTTLGRTLAFTYLLHPGLVVDLLQEIKSAFLMAFTTLTNPKTIFSLGPNRSILGTIIRPDPVLLERKGGSNDYEEESFPRGDDSAQSSGKKRKASSKEKSRKKKVKESGEMERHEESGSRKERSSKKKRWRHNRENANGFS
ncbi:hypothetical protein Patl1_04646 [Pistacia atlantica]|uniref:Uncharacterized protein n=1 Tax=Pistacia atlantica TaxID=434234 RepID=A0ACC1BWM9_9ROSI|nr:hypothetical protein Patl1_04646 [Pistacia atlantica]